MSRSFSLTIEEPTRIGRRDYDPEPIGPHDVRIETLYSGISAGTEMTAVLGSNPYLSKHWDPELRLFQEGSSSKSYPMDCIGYEEVGRVVETGAQVTRIREGQIVWGAWGHRSHRIAAEDWAADRVLPEGVEPKLGIFAQIGAIALNCVIDANIHVGEFVAVFGQGVPGQLVTQLARANGATVIAVDQHAARLDVAKACGASFALNPADGDVAARIREITAGRGADVSIEISGAYPALQEAIRSTAYNSRVVVGGFFQGGGTALRLGEEFHHNRIELVCSQISGLSPSLDHRWTRLRLDQTVMRLVAEGKVDFGRLISHTIAAANAQEAFDLLKDSPQDALQIVLDFRENQS